jgi:hypothetical protein
MHGLTLRPAVTAPVWRAVGDTTRSGGGHTRLRRPGVRRYAGKFADEHDDKIDAALDKAGDAAGDKFGHADQIDKGVDWAQEHTGPADQSNPPHGNGE